MKKLSISTTLILSFFFSAVSAQTLLLMPEGNNFIKYDLVSLGDGELKLRLGYERYIYRRAVAVEIGFARFEANPFSAFPENGSTRETVDVSAAGSSYCRPRNVGDSPAYNIKGVSLTLGVKVFPMNFESLDASIWFNYIKKGFYVQPEYQINSYTIDYVETTAEVINCRRIGLFGGEVVQDRTQKVHKNVNSSTDVFRVNLGYQLTFYRHLHVDISYGLGAVVAYKRGGEKQSIFLEGYRPNPFRIELGVSF